MKICDRILRLKIKLKIAACLMVMNGILLFLSINAKAGTIGLNNEISSPLICDNPPTIEPISDISFCEGGSVIVQAILGGSAVSVTWTGGTGIYSYPNFPDLTILEYLPDSSEAGTTITMTVTTDDPDSSGPCVAAFTQFHLMVNALPTVIITGSDTLSCPGSPTNLTFTLTGTPPFSFSFTDGSNTFGPYTTNNYSEVVPVSPLVPTVYFISSIFDSNCDGYPVSSWLVDSFFCPDLTLNLTCYIEGFMRPGGMMENTLYNLYVAGIGDSTSLTATDTITVNLWSTGNLLNPNPDFSSRAILHTNGMASVVFTNASAGNYYIAVKQRNSLETWSHDTVPFINDVPAASYDFSTALSKAFDDGSNPPMKSVAGVFAFYSGDINQSGGIDILDMSVADNDASAFAFGYNPSDVSGNMGTDIIDMSIVDNNAQLFLFYARP